MPAADPLRADPEAKEKRDYDHDRLLGRYPMGGSSESSQYHYIEAFYNRSRRHSTLGTLAPAAFEAQHATGELVVLPPRAGAHAKNLKNCA